MYFDLITLCGALSTLPVLWGIRMADRSVCRPGRVEEEK